MPAHPDGGKARTVSHRALREGSPYFTSFLAASGRGDYNSQRPPRGSGGADDARAPPPIPPPPAKVCARIPWRELRAAVGQLVVPGVTRRTAARGVGERQVRLPTRGWETWGGARLSYAPGPRLRRVGRLRRSGRGVRSGGRERGEEGRAPAAGRCRALVRGGGGVGRRERAR